MPPCTAFGGDARKGNGSHSNLGGQGRDLISIWDCQGREGALPTPTPDFQGVKGKGRPPLNPSVGVLGRESPSTPIWECQGKEEIFTPILGVLWEGRAFSTPNFEGIKGKGRTPS